MSQGAPGDGSAIGDPDVGEHVRVSLVVREERLVSSRPCARLQPGDDVLLMFDPKQTEPDDVARVFTGR
ncbi:hypothetical protein ACQ4WX_40650 [Streptomyces lasalocidi]